MAEDLLNVGHQKNERIFLVPHAKLLSNDSLTQ